MLKKMLFLFIILAAVPAISYASLGPFGLSVGTTTISEARAQLSSRTKLEGAGINKWSNGPMLKSRGTGLGLNGLQEVLLIFNKNNILVGVVLTLNKNRYSDIKRMLSDQYIIISDEAPFVGNQLATFRKGDLTIEASAPHMSFQMEVNYFHRTLMEAFNRGSKKEQQEQERRERSQL